MTDSTSLETYIGAQIPDLAAALQTNLQASNITVPYNNLVYWLSDYAEEYRTINLQLSKTKPDFEQIKQQMIARLRQKDSWRDLIQAGVGETLLEFVAAVGDYGQTSILRAYQETSYDARLTSSVYTITRFLGVHIDRKVPAEVIVNLYGDEDENIDSYYIPPYSQFQVNGIAFFNRDVIVFNGATSLNPTVAKLYQGQVVIENFTSFGTPFQTVEIGNNDYRVADADIKCYVNDVEFTRTTEGLWHYSGTDNVFFEQTTPNGNVEIVFGNSLFGSVPQIDQTISFVYVLTDGDSVNTTVTNQSITLVEVNTVVPERIKGTSTQVTQQITDTVTKVQGISVSSVYNGGAEKDKDFYSILGPGIRAANKKIVTRPDHRALGMNFPNVADVLFQGQRELARTKIGFTNVVGVTVLKKDGTVFTDAEWLAYTDYLRGLEIWRVEFLRIDPEPVYFDFTGDVYCTQTTDLANIKLFIRRNVEEFFRPKLNIIGKSVYENDAETLYKFNYSSSTVDYVRNVLPNVDTILTKNGFHPQYPVLRSFLCNSYYSTRSYSSISPKILGSV